VIRIIFIKACEFNKRKRVVGNITTVIESKAEELFSKQLAREYTGEYPPKRKTKINLKDLK